MITLNILRHAKSSWDDASARDFDRPLNARGRQAAERMGRELKQRRIGFDRVLASPAVRVRQTIDRVADGYGALPEFNFDDSIYEAGERFLIAMVRALPADLHAPLIVGHNPGLHSLVMALTSDDEQGLRAKIAAKFPTAAFAAIEFPSRKWSEVEPGSGLLRVVIVPRELD